MSRFAAVVLAAPLLLAATVSDPRGDVVDCRGRGPSDERAIDLVGAEAQATEGGSAIRFTMTFAAPLPVPDREGRPLRVDILVRDPDVPTVSLAYYRRLNRIVRFDAVVDPGLTILLLPERGSNTFFGVHVDDARLVIELPGRLLIRDVDLEGPPLERLTWSVVARDEGSCDFIGEGRPTLAVTPADQTSAPPVTLDGSSDGSIGWAAALLAGAAVVGGYVWLRRRATDR